MAWTHGAILPPQALVTAMALAILCGGIWYPLSNLILAANAQAGYTIWYVGLAATAVVAAFGLVGRYGATGAAGAMAALDLAMLIVVVRLMSRMFATRLSVADGLSALREYAGRVPWIGQRHPLGR